MTTKTVAAFLGGGPGGCVVALRAAQPGAQVVLIEEEEIGGERPNVSSIPTKAQLRPPRSTVSSVCAGRCQIPGRGKAVDTLQV